MCVINSAPKDWPVDVLGSEAVLLGKDITCDGFHKNRSIRIQTHAHEDHMNEFSCSKSGTIILTKPTLKLLEYKHRDLPYRSNVHVLEYGEPKSFLGNTVELRSSNHILGAAQAMVTTPDKVKLGYSGDFGWPLDDFIKVDILVVDATYGAPSQTNRLYSQEDAQQEFINLTRSLLQRGAVHICASLGPMQRALYSLETEELSNNVAVIATRQVKHIVDVHKDFGIPMPEITIDGSVEAREAILSGNYIKLHGTYSVVNDGLIDGSVVQLTTYRVAGQDPITEFSDRSFRVGLSNHANFDQTIEYISKTGAQMVVTDCVRAKNRNGIERNKAIQLAHSIRRELGVEAYPASGHVDLRWGV